MGVVDLRKYRFIIVLITVVILFFMFMSACNFILKTIYPFHYKEIIKKYSDEYDLDIHLVAAVIRAESKFDTNAISPKGAKGLMQISSITGKWASKELNIEDYSEAVLYKPDVNIRIGCWYLDKLKKEFDNNFLNVLAAYNAGSGNVSKWLLNDEYSLNRIDLIEIPFAETKNYIKRVHRNYKIYKYLYKELN